MDVGRLQEFYCKRCHQHCRFIQLSGVYCFKILLRCTFKGTRVITPVSSSYEDETGVEHIIIIIIIIA